MARSKPMGIDKEKYKAVQEIKSEEDFKSITFQKLQGLQFAVEELNNSILQVEASQGSNFKLCEIEIHHVMDLCVNSLKEFRSAIDACEKTANYSMSLVKALNVACDDYVKTERLDHEIYLLKEEIKVLRNEKASMRKDFDAALHRMYADFEGRLAATKQEILSQPSEIPNIKNLLEQKLQLVDLNGQNAVLRSANNENQIMLVERKIENIYQLIKKMDMKQQESTL